MNATTRKPGRPKGSTPYHNLLKKHGITEREAAQRHGYKSHGSLLSSKQRDRFRNFVTWLIESVEASIKQKLS